MNTVDKIMTARVATVDMDATLKEIREIFEQASFHHILVLENKSLVGVISDRDLLKTISPYANTPAERARDAATLRKRAHQIMTRRPITVAADGSILEAIRLFVEQKISCLPVLDNDGGVAGILTWRDVLKAIVATVERAHGQ